MFEVAPLLLPFDVRLELPGSKSHANRALVLAALAEGETELHGATPCEDVALLVQNLQTLGYDATWRNYSRGIVHVRGGVPQRAPRSATELDCSLAGTTLRFLCALAARTPGEWIVTGNERMRERPIGPLTTALRALGVEAEDRGGRPPVRIVGGALGAADGPRRVTLEASVSSQFLSALLLVAPSLPHGLEIELPTPPTSRPYIELTLRTLAEFGIDATWDDRLIAVPAGPARAPGRFEVEGDWSSAGPWLVLERLLRGRFQATNLHADSAQGDRLLPRYLDALDRPGAVRLDVTKVPDQLMNLAVRALFRDAPTRFIGAANLRYKECDRLAVTVEALRAFGCPAEEEDDGILVEGLGGRLEQLRRAAPPTWADHRMAMAFAILGAAGVGAGIDHPGCAAKSYPGFFDDLETVRRSPRCIAICGMRGVGKSTLARRLGPKLGLAVVDTDKEFEERHGPIDIFVDAYGWETFRAREAEVVADALRPGNLVALGGGALETPATVERLREQALLVWLQEDVEALLPRLTRRKRPSLTGKSIEEEVREVLARREPVWRAAADLIVPPGGDLRVRLKKLRAELAMPSTRC